MIKKMLMMTLVVILALSSLIVCASAVTLAESFSGGSNKYVVANINGSFNDYYKAAWAKTSGYYKYHYVRALVGLSPDDNLADTGRRYSYGDIKATTKRVWIANDSVVYLVLNALPGYRSRAYYGST